MKATRGHQKTFRRFDLHFISGESAIEKKKRCPVCFKATEISLVEVHRANGEQNILGNLGIYIPFIHII